MAGNMKAAAALMRISWRRNRLTAAGFWIWVVSVGLYQLLGLAFVWVTASRLSTGSQRIATYIYGVFQGATAIAYAFGAWTVFFASHYVRQGKLDALIMLAPDPRLSLPFTHFEPAELFSAASGFGIALMGLRVGGELSLSTAALTLVGIASGAAITYSLFMAAATVSLYAVHSSAAIHFAMDLVHFGQYPVNLYPDAMRTLFTWVMPLALIANAPAGLIARRVSTAATFAGVAGLTGGAALAVAAANALFKRAISRFITHW